MKRGKIVGIFRFLGGFKLNKISNKEVRSFIMSNHLCMNRVVKEHDEDIKEMQQRLFEGKEEELRKLHELRNKYNASNDKEEKADIVKIIHDNYAPILELEKEFNDFFSKKFEEDVDIKITKCDMEDFIEACVECEVDITTSDLMEIAEMFNN
jgi:hypothetical protein